MDKLFKEFQVSCNNCNLDTICLPRGLSQQEVENLSNIIKNNSTLQQGEYIYRQGDEFKGIFAIKSGMTKLVTNDSEGNEHILNILLPGELAGFDGLNKKKHNCSAIALNISSYCILPLSAEKFAKVFQQIPSIAHELFKHSSESICESHSKIVINKRSAEEKTALFLINLSERLERRGFSSLSFNLPLSRQEIGNHLGLTLETVSRMLQQLQNKRLITIQRKKIKINNLYSLKKICIPNNN